MLWLLDSSAVNLCLGSYNILSFLAGLLLSQYEIFTYKNDGSINKIKLARLYTQSHNQLHWAIKHT